MRNVPIAATLICLPALASAASFTFIVAGLGGEPEYEQRFREETAVIGAAAVEAAGGDKSHVVMLTGEQARRDSLRRELQEFAAKIKPADSVTVVLIGHGTFDGENYRFNVPGTDITGSELGQLFDRLPAKKQLIVNATSSSGATIELWQRPERGVITATKSGGERTATRFAQYWGQAVSGDVAQFQASISPDVVGATVMPGVLPGTHGGSNGYEGFGINRFSAQKEAAASFIREVAGFDVQKAMNLTKILPSSRIDVLDDPEVVAAYALAPTLVEQGKIELDAPVRGLPAALEPHPSERAPTGRRRAAHGARVPAPGVSWVSRNVSVYASASLWLGAESSRTCQRTPSASRCSPVRKTTGSSSTTARKTQPEEASAAP